MEIGQVVEGQVVAEVGVSWYSPFGRGFSLTPVMFVDGAYGIISRSDESPARIWVPNNPEAAQAIMTGIEMPTVDHGIGSDVIHVRGKDGHGRFLVKLFYGMKAMIHYREDELHRFPA